MLCCGFPWVSFIYTLALVSCQYIKFFGNFSLLDSLGFSLLVGAGAHSLMMKTTGGMLVSGGHEKKLGVRLTKLTLLLLLALFASKTWLRNQDWASRDSLFT